jgi:nucleoid-associated protein YgaU
LPFRLEDLDRIKIRVGTSDKSLRDLSDNQFTAWLRNIGAEGTMTVVKLAPGKYVTPIEDRIRILNELDATGFPIPGVTAPTETAGAPHPTYDASKLQALQAALRAAATNIEEAQGLAQELGEIDPRVNLRQSLAGSLALMDAARGAAERALKASQV